MASDLKVLTKDLTWISKGGAGYYVLYGEPDVDEVVQGAAALLDDEPHLFVLTSDRLGYRDRVALKEAFETGRPLIVGVTGAATMMVSLFFDVRDSANSTAPSPIRMLPVVANARPGSRLSGLLVLHIRKTDTPQEGLDALSGESGHRLFYAEASRELAERGRGRDLPIQRIGSTLTVRDLVPLDERDPPETRARALDEIFADRKGPISWSELRLLLGSGMDLSGIVERRNCGALSPEQFDFCVTARKLLDDRSPERLPSGGSVYPSIFDLVWALENTPLPGALFRGQFDADWRLDPSLYRLPANGSLDNGTIVERLARTSRFLAKLRANQARYLGGTVGDDALLAVAQHFGMPTHLLDFSRSVRVAAFFATLDNAKGRPGTRIGVVYVLGRSDSPYSKALDDQNVRLALADVGQELDLSIAELAGFNVGDFRQIAPDLPDRDDRIRRQEGVFVENFDPRHLRTAGLRAYYFRHEPGVVFEDPRRGITKAELLPDGTGLSELAESMSSLEGAAAISLALDQALHGIPIARESIIGTMHQLLRVQIDAGATFFQDLRLALDELGEEDATQVLREIFKRYFIDSRLHAVLTEDGPAGDAEAYGEVSAALGRASFALARWAGVNENAFTESFAPELTGAPSPIDVDLRRPTAFAPKNLRQRIVLACGYYLCSWEHLRFVGGRRARDLAEKARDELRR